MHPQRIHIYSSQQSAPVSTWPIKQLPLPARIPESIKNKDLKLVIFKKLKNYLYEVPMFPFFLDVWLLVTYMERSESRTSLPHVKWQTVRQHLFNFFTVHHSIFQFRVTAFDLQFLFSNLNCLFSAHIWTKKVSSVGPLIASPFGILCDAFHSSMNPLKCDSFRFQ